METGGLPEIRTRIPTVKSRGIDAIIKNSPLMVGEHRIERFPHYTEGLYRPRARTTSFAHPLNGTGGEIRTHDLLLPKQAD